jgi:hypothetical protein
VPESLPDPPVDRTGWWRSPPPPLNPDVVATPAAGPMSTAAIVALAWALAVFVGIGFLALTPAAEAVATLVPAVLFGVLATIVFVVAKGMLDTRRWARQEREAAEQIAAWAAARGAAFEPGGQLPEATPLLGRGDSRWATRVVTGELPGGLPGVLAGYVYRVEDSDGDNDRIYKHTVVVARLPETLGFLRELSVEPRAGFDLLDRLGERIRGRRRIELESAALSERFEICIPETANETWVRRLFTPAFVDWLATSTPDKLAFELHDDVLCVSIPREVLDRDYLEAFCRTASFVAARLRQEALEGARRPAASRFAESVVPATPSPPVSAHDWSGAPPADAGAAARPFISVARREPATWRAPLLHAAVALVGGTLLVAAPAKGSNEWDFSAVAVAAGVAIALVVLAVSIRASIRRRASEYGKESFVAAYGHRRGLAPEDPTAFHARYVEADLPGAATHVLSGRLGGLGRQGSLALCRDHPGGAKNAEYAVVVTPAGDDRLPTLRATQGPLRVSRENGIVVVSMRRDRRRPLSAAELDGFLESTRPLVEQAGAAPP